MEAGARALGQRSILADPRKKNMSKKINQIIKYRETWRPFCPSVIKENVKEYFKRSYDSKFMTISFEAKKQLKKIAPAVVHIDNTCRIQSVSKTNNLKFYKLIKEFFKITKVPLLLNTSFNLLVPELNAALTASFPLDIASSSATSPAVLSSSVTFLTFS